MNERAAALPWMVIRQDDDGGRYRVGRYATLLEAQALAERLTAQGERGAHEERDDHAEWGGQGGHDGKHAVDSGSPSGAEAGRGSGEARTVSATRVRRYVVERLDYPGGDQA